MLKVLVVHNRYLLRGGEDECLDAEVRLLRRHGHDVEVFIEDNQRVTDIGLWRTAARTIWSQESYTRLQCVLRARSYDLVAVHNFFPLLSPSVYYAAEAAGVPVVQTLHNYRLLCPNAEFYRHGRVCEDCLGKVVPWPGVAHACYRSRPATSAVAAMLIAHRLLRTWLRKVAVFIAPTEFARGKFVQGGLPSDRIGVKPNFVDPDPGAGAHRGGYALFVGRLDAAKGIRTLLGAWEQAGTRVPLKIVGDGPLSAEVLSRAKSRPGVEWLGRRGLPEVYELMGDATVLIIPSELYETFGRVVIEAYAKGTPVIAANIGAVAELVEDGRTGLLFAPGDASGLAAKVDWARDHSGEMAEMAFRVRREYESKYTAEQNYQMLLGIYEQAIRIRGRR